MPLRRSSPLLLTPLVAFLVLSLSACADDSPRSTAAEFLRVSADLTVTDGDTAHVDLPFTAEDDDPVWDGVREVHLINDLGTGDLVYAGSTTPEPFGEDGSGEGVLRFDVRTDSLPLALSEVLMVVEEGGENQHIDVGSWTLDRVPDRPAVVLSGGYPADAPACGPTSLELQSVTGADVHVTDVRGVSGTEETDISPQGTTVDMRPDCDDSVDLQLITPVATSTTGGGSVTQSVLPTLRFRGSD